MSDPGDFHAHRPGVTGAGAGSQTATGSLVASASSASNTVVRCDEKRQEQRDSLAEEDGRGAVPGQCHITSLRVAESVSQLVVESGCTDAGRLHSGADASQGALFSIEKLSGRFPRARLPVRLEGVTLLCIGCEWDPPYRYQWKGRGKGQHKREEAETGKPVYFGDDNGRVICTLASGDIVKRIPDSFPRNAYVDISSLMPPAGEPGVLYWTESTQVSQRVRPRDADCDYIFPYKVTSEYSKDFASMSFVQDCAVGTHVAIAMRITEVQPRWTVALYRPYLQLSGVDTEGGVVGPLRLWQREAGDIRPGGAYVVRGLRVVHDRMWDSARRIWTRSTAAPKTIERSARTACEDVEDVETITQFL